MRRAEELPPELGEGPDGLEGASVPPVPAREPVPTLDTPFAFEVSALVGRLRDEAKLTPKEIAEALENRVTSRTVYRWQNRETIPGNKADFEALQQLVLRKCKGSVEGV